MKKISILIVFIVAGFVSKAQTIESFQFNLYTDSLKKGTYNYINIVGKLSNGKYRPLDSTQLIFSSSYGKFYGNSLWLPFDADIEKVDITVKNRKKQVLHQTIYIKKAADTVKLKTEDEIMDTPPKRARNKKH